MWSRNFDACVGCASTQFQHMAKGLCNRCYLQRYQQDPANRTRIEVKKQEWYYRYHDDNLLKQANYRNEKQFDGIRDQVLARDRYRCVRCNRDRNLIIHHKDRSGRGKDAHNNDLANLETLCRACHLAEHRAEHPPKKHPKLNRWSRKHDQCLRCKTTSIKHSSNGYCRTCIHYYNKMT